MGLFQRVSDIITANLNEMIERYENPEAMLKQAVREMEASIAAAKRDVAHAMAHATVLSRRLAEQERTVEQWQTRAQTAVSAGDDHLARKALQRRQECDKLVAALSSEFAAASEVSHTLRRQLDAMQAKLSEAQRHLATLVARSKAAELQQRLELSKVDPKWNQNPFAAFERLRVKVELAEAEADAILELSSHRYDAADDDGDALRLSVELEAELLELKLRQQPLA